MRATVFFFLILSVLITSADAQRPRGRMRLDRMTLLGVPEVQDELGLSAEQNESIEAATKEMGDPPPPPPRGEELSDDERAELRQEMEQREAKEVELLTDILTDDQQGRLRQIMLQVLGARALFSPEMRESLGITDDQQEAMQATRDELNSQMREKMRALFQQGPGPQMREKVQELREDMEDKVLAHLSDEQRAKLDEMKGKAFELSMEAIFRNRGGPGQRRPRGDRPDRPARPPIDS